MPLFRPTHCEINTSALRHNYRQLKALAGEREVLGVVKANAYGHGAVQVARILANEGVRIFGVASVEEGIELRRSGITGRILCFGGPLGASASDLLEFGIEPVIFNEEDAKRLAQQAHGSPRPLSLHLKVDTGMGRLGIPLRHFDSLLKRILSSPSLKLESVMTHLARADEPDAGPTDHQIQNFTLVEEAVKRLQPSLPVFHLCNSAALMDRKLGDTQWVRPGIALYGAYPHPRFRPNTQAIAVEGEGDTRAPLIDLRPVMSWKTQIISLKEFPAGSPLSYGGAFVTRRPSKIAIVPVGYADGYSRAFSNKGVMLVRGRRVPVVGRVCMDLSLIDVSDLAVVELGDEVVVMGSQGEESVRAEELAGLLGTISYEIFCAVSARVPRLLVNNGEPSND